MTKQIRNFTITPNHLYDVIMPQVTDAEWRLISIILRQIIGWRFEDGSHKVWDWLSHSQLKARMNRSSATVSKTISSLAKKGLIEVVTGTGKQVRTALERRNAHTRLYFRLSNNALGRK
jgi:DNA-binding MarR family transcriptional regulator